MVQPGVSVRGSFLVLLLPTVLLLVFSAVAVVDAGRILYAREKAAQFAENALLSALRVRIEGMEKLADRWENIRLLLNGADADGVVISSFRWTALQTETTNLKKALPGYKGRITSVVTAVLQANGAEKDMVVLDEKRKPALDLTLQPALVRDETGFGKTVDSVWLRREWEVDESAPSRVGDYTAQGLIPFRFINTSFQPDSPLFATQSVTGRLTWNADLKEALVRDAGNGGFPSTWDEAFLGSDLQPFRFPLYSAEGKP